MTTTITLNREPLFENTELANEVLGAIFFGKRKQWYYLLSFVIMPDHIHLLIIPREKDISECMKSIKGFSARKINELIGRKGSIWQRSFYDYILDNEEKVLNRISYIEENPVRKGIVRDTADFYYSSARHREETDFSKFF